MSLITSTAAMTFRRVGRALGLNRVLRRLLMSQGYEERFSKLLLDSVQPGDCVWDVGANVGLYSFKFSDHVGVTGKVFCFEPSEQNMRKLTQATKERKNVIRIQCALGESQGHAYFEQGIDDLGATSRVLASEDANAPASVLVGMNSGDDLVKSGKITQPNLIKIDTEGFELDVLRGLQAILGTPALRSIFIEVHFGLLEARGYVRAPAEIEGLLKGSGFHARWIDASHLVGTKPKR